MSSIVAGVDGGGSQTTLALADANGRELHRQTGPAGLVDPRFPEASAEVLIDLLRRACAQASATLPVASLCAGLAGVGYPAERAAVRSALARAGVAARVLVVSDGEIALEGAFAGGPGILLVAGTGSIAYGRGVDGGVERCGGWGMVVGDEGSGYWIGRTALQRALQAEDGRGEPTRLLPALLDRLELPGPGAIPPWAGRAAKAQIAGIAPLVVALADGGDRVSAAILDEAAAAIVRHAVALYPRLDPHGGTVSVVLHGGLGRHRSFRDRIERALAAGTGLRLVEPRGDAVAGALRLALHADHAAVSLTATPGA